MGLQKKRITLAVISISILLIVTTLGIFNSPIPFKRLRNTFDITKDLPKSDTIYGIDISHYQGDIDWKTLGRDKDIAFVYLRASMGSENKDCKAQEYALDASKNGLLVGLYHFFYLQTDVKQQFENFDSVYSSIQSDLIPVLDIEAEKGRRRRPKTPPPGLCDSIQKFIDLFHEKYPNETPAIYASQTFFNHYLSHRFQQSLKWIANYSQYPVMRDSLVFHLWQYTDKAQIEGINGKVDMNVIVRDDALPLLRKKKDINVIMPMELARTISK